MYYLTLHLVFIATLIQMGTSDSAPTTYGMVKTGLTYVFGLLGLNVWVFPFAFFLTEDHWQCWPHNGPLWYVQGLLFCWLTYPVLRDYMCGPSWTRGSTLMLVVGLGIGGVVPIALLIWAVGHPMLWLLIKVFPIFMLPAFYLGAAACELYMQELQASEAEDDEMTASAGTSWTRLKRDWAGFIGEFKLVLFLCVQLESYHGVFSSQTHSWALLFGSILYLFAVAAAHSGDHAYSLGIRWLLGSEWVVFLGDASFCAYTFQEPIAIAYYWATRSGVFGQHMGQHWMPPWEFAIYLALLYALAIPFGLYVNTPVSAWILEKLTSTFPVVPPLPSPRPNVSPRR